MRITLHSRPFIGKSGRKMQSTLTADALHPYVYYTAYPYFRIHTSDTPSNGGNWDRVCKRLYGPDEWLLRDRRCIAFSDASGLQPVRTPPSCRLIDEVRRVITLDHASVWQASDSTSFVLTEPYGNYTACERDEKVLKVVGYHSIPIPTALAPYNGGALGAVGDEPDSYSQLICREEDGGVLRDIWVKLEVRAIWTPAWNDTSGVRAVVVRP